MEKAFKERLSQLLDQKIEITINENRSTMLRLLNKRGEALKLSCHKIFLEAPENVMSALVHYVQGKRKERKAHNLILRQFIQERLEKSDLTHLIDPKKLIHQGAIYDLKEIYQQLNNTYFKGELDLSITWFAHKKKRPRRRITFGQYLSGLRLIKIHRMLDDPFFPDFFVKFVVYHEMVHSVVPGSVDKQGRRYCFHHAAFKAREKEFEHYGQAVEWERKNKTTLFSYGWT